MNKMNFHVCRKYEPKVTSKLEILNKITNSIILIHEHIPIIYGKERLEL